MKVHVKCFAQLAKDDVCDYHGTMPHYLYEGASVQNLIKKLGLRHEDIKLIFVNHVIVPPDSTLHEDDKIALAPATGGM